MISFSAQTNNDLNFEKIKNKDSDYLVINNLSDNYFGSDMNKVTIINKNSSGVLIISKLKIISSYIQ